jgi:hypothetical protein
MADEVSMKPMKRPICTSRSVAANATPATEATSFPRSWANERRATSRIRRDYIVYSREEPESIFIPCRDDSKTEKRRAGFSRCEGFFAMGAASGPNRVLFDGAASGPKPHAGFAGFALSHATPVVDRRLSR